MKTILLADDSITIQKVVELTFSDGEYQVVCVSNGAQALKKMPEVRPDIVLLDVIMPERSGYEVCEQMKADPALSRIPVLLLTGTFEPFDRRRAEAAGASGHLTKPFESHTLVGRVEELLAQGPITRAPGPAPVTQAAAPPPPRPVTTPISAAPTAAESSPASQAGSARPPVLQTPVEPAPMPVTPHPAFAPPDAADGGSYLGFGDLGLDDAEEPVVPDRFDEAAPASSTVRISRGDARVLPVSPAPVEAEEAPPPSGPAGAMMEGFMPGYEFPEGMQRPVTPAESGRPNLHNRPDPGRMESPDAGPAATQAADLSDESLERLADLVVRKMSERVVREIAWEVIPGVAEALVRQRIKELEENER